MYRRIFIASTLLTTVLGSTQAALAASRLHSAKTILVVGDSLSAEYGLQRGTGWVALLEQRLQNEKIKTTVVNASISGDTSAGGRARLEALLARNQPSHVIIELGGNDALRGLPLQQTQNNLSEMTRLSQQSGAKVLLLGMQLPPNYGADYGQAFAALYSKVARENGAGLVPFFLKDIVDTAQVGLLFQADRIHPTERAQALLLANVWPELRKLLK